MAPTKYRGVSIPEGLYAQVEEIVKAPKSSYSSVADFVKEAIREKLAKMRE